MSSPGALELTLEDKSALRRAYMPFIRNGGVFVRTDRPYKLGDDVTVTIRLFDASGPVGIEGTVVWVTPTRAQGKREAGVGVQFGADETYRAHIEGLLGGISGGDAPTHTL